LKEYPVTEHWVLGNPYDAASQLLRFYKFK